jgi:hypothetical protein
MPRSVVMSVGISWGGPETRTCGISVGPARSFGGSRGRPIRDSGLPLAGQVRDSVRVAGSRGWLGCQTRLISDGASRPFC